MWLYSQTQHLLRMEGKNIWGQAEPGDKEAMHGSVWGAHRREPAGWARPVWGRAGGRQHAGGLARSEQSRSIQVVAVSQEGGTEVALGQGEGRMGVALDRRHPCPYPHPRKMT